MWWNKRNRPDVTLYFRSDGPVCYEVNTWPTLDEVASFVDGLPASGLVWYWQSGYAEIGVEAPPEAKVQPLARLDISTREHFEDNLWYVDDCDNGLEITIYGFAPPPGSEVDADYLSKALQRFALSEPGPLQVVIYQGCDSRTLRIFTPLSPALSVRSMLSTYGASPETASKRDYRRLRGFQLEEILHIGTCQGPSGAGESPFEP